MFKKLGRAVASYCVASLIALFSTLFLTTSAQAEDDHSKVFQLNLPEQSLAQALNRLSEQTDIQVLFPYEIVNAKKANTVVGTFTLQKALDTMLQNTGLNGGLTDSGVITISQIDLNSNGKGKDDMNIKTKKSLLATLIAFFATGAVTQGVMAQDVSSDGQAAKKQNQIDEIIVTAQKREERLIDVPISISAISGEDLDRASIQNIADLSYAVPNLSTVEIGPGLQLVTIRGVGNIRGNSATVGIYLDEIPLSSSPYDSLDLQVVDLQRVEVLKGPQGTLYGQGSMGGTLRYITNDPSFDDIEGKVTLSGYDTHKGSWSEELTGFVNIPVIDDTLAFRVSATYKDKSGWLDQPAAGLEDVNDSELSNIRIKGLLQATDELAIKGAIIRHRNNYGAYSQANTTPLKESNFQRAVFPDQPVERGISDYDLYNLTISYDFDFATLISSSSKHEQETAADNSQFANFTFGAAEILFPSQRSYGKSFSQDIRLTSNTNSAENNPFDWTLGVFYNDGESLADWDTVWVAFPPGAPFDLGASATEKSTKSIAYYGDMSYAITPQLTLGLGARYFEDDQTLLEFQGSDANILREATFDKLSSRVYLSYAWTDNLNTYFNVSEGFRSGGFNQQGQPNYDPEQVLAYELGTKSSLLDNRLNANVALFYSHYDDYITISTLPDDISIGIIGNVGEAVIKGIEWSVDWAVTDQLSIGFNGAVTEAEFTRITSTAPTPTNIRGERLPFVPKYGYSVNSNYHFNWSSAVAGDFHLSYNREGQSTFISRGQSFSPESYQNEPFGFLDAQLSAQWQSLSLELFGQNLLDEDKLVSVSATKQSSQHRPRALGIRLSYDF